MAELPKELIEKVARAMNESEDCIAWPQFQNTEDARHHIFKHYSEAAILATLEWVRENVSEDVLKLAGFKLMSNFSDADRELLPVSKEVYAAFREKIDAITEKKDAPASDPPGPVNCTHVLRREGRPYPRTCERCGLGPCPFYDKDGAPKYGGGPR